MKEPIGRLVTIVAAVVFCSGLIACSEEARESAEDAGEHASAEAGSEHASAAEADDAEGAGEHASAEGQGEHGEAREGHGEHGEGDEHGEGGESHGAGGEEGEESGVYIGADETWDVVRRGARLVLSFDAESNAFVGTVENTTDQTLCALRVEVHLSSGTELGPTERTDVAAGGTTDVVLPTEGEAFDTWTAHPEMSACGG